MVWRIRSPRRRARELGAHEFAASAPCISILLALVISAAAAFDCAAAPSEPAIVVEGNRRIDADAIRAHFHPAPGAQLDAAALDAALKEL
jgi:hypothetical protein